MENNNKNKSILLKMPYGTATNRLRKSIIFMLAGRLGLLTCFRCNKRIENIDDFSVEHKEAWQQASDPEKMFFDLDNITFSHLGCNIRSASKPWRKITKPGFRWCWKCQSEKESEFFCKSNNKCRSCRTKMQALRRFRTPIV